MRNQITNEETLINKLSENSELIQSIEERLENANLLGINIGMLEGRFLQTLVCQQDVEKVVEIGSQYGCSTVYMAQALGKRGVIWATEKDEMCIKEAEKTFSLPEVQMTGCKINLLKGDALETLTSIEDQGPFDLVFIDANKSGYLNYYHWAKKFLRPGGYLVADNVYLFGTMFAEEPPPETPKKMCNVMRQFLQEIFADPEFTASFVPTKEGILFAVKSGQ